MCFSDYKANPAYLRKFRKFRKAQSGEKNHDFFLKFDLNNSFPGGSTVNGPPANARDSGLIPGRGTSLGEGNGNPLQNSCLENPVDRGAGGLQSVGVQRVRHMLSTKQQQQQQQQRAEQHGSESVSLLYPIQRLAVTCLPGITYAVVPQYLWGIASQTPHPPPHPHRVPKLCNA